MPLGVYPRAWHCMVDHTAEIGSSQCRGFDKHLNHQDVTSERQIIKGDLDQEKRLGKGSRFVVVDCRSFTGDGRWLMRVKLQTWLMIGNDDA